MELKEGVYVKYTRGAINGYVPPRIGKIIEKINDSEFLKIDSNCVILESDIAKASNNIIDLIEVGDVLIYKHPAFEKEYVERIDGKECLELRKSFFKEKSLKLLAIVTKKQFESMSYEVSK